MTAEQFKQLMDKLADIERRLPPSVAPVHPGEIRPLSSSGYCLNCGGYHGGLQCPHLSPWASTTACGGHTIGQLYNGDST